MTLSSSHRPTLDATSRVAIPESVYARAFGDEVVLLEFGGGAYFGLDAVGAEIWKGLEVGDTLGAVADRLVARYEVAPEEALADVIRLTAELAEASVLTPTNA